MRTQLDGFNQVQKNLNTNRVYQLGEIEGFQRRQLSAQNCTDLYEANGIAAKIVNRLAGDATRKGFRLKGADQDLDWDAINSYVEDYNVKGLLANHIRWSRVYGGSCLVAAVNDGRKYELPINLENISGIIAFHVVPSPLIIPDLSKVSRGIGTRSYLSPTYYNLLRPEDIGAHFTQGRAIHFSRLHRLDASVVSPLTSTSGQGWGPSVYEQIIRSLERLLSVYGNSAEVVRTASMIVLQLRDFTGKIEAGDQDKLDEMAQMIASNLSTYNLLMIDKEDMITEVKRTLTELANVMGAFENALIADTDMPREILFGLTEHGLNSGTNSGAFQNWYDKVSQYQEEFLTPALNFILGVLFGYRRTSGLPVPEEWTVEWAPLQQPSPEQTAELRLKTAQADELYHRMGVYTPEQIQRKRSSSEDPYGPIELDDEDRIQAAPAAPAVGPDGLPVQSLDEETEPQQADYAPPEGEVPLSAQELAARAGVSAGVIKGMHGRGEIGGWKIGSRWRYLLSEVLQASHRPKPG